jgi:anti-anti-sigma factor
MMFENGLGDHHGRLIIADGMEIPSVDSSGTGHPRPSPAERSRLRLRIIERMAIVRFVDCEFLIGGAIAREVIGQLEHLVNDQGCARLLLNFGGVRYLSSGMLAALAGLQEEVSRRGGRVQLCGLDPLLRDLLRFSGLDWVFDDCADEAEALGLLVR